VAETMTKAQKALDAHELQMLLWNGSSNVAPMWKKIAI